MKCSEANGSNIFVYCPSNLFTMTILQMKRSVFGWIAFLLITVFAETQTAQSQDLVIYFLNEDTEAIPVETIDKMEIQEESLKVYSVEGGYTSYFIGTIVRYEFDFTTGVAVQYENLLQDVKVFPNPATDMVTIGFNLNRTTDIRLELVDLQGRIVQQKEHAGLTTGQYNLQLTHPNPSASGYYYVRIISNNRINVKPVVFTP